jgi:hypothetical protein
MEKIKKSYVGILVYIHIASIHEAEMGDCEFKASLGYITRTCLKTNKK